MVQSLLRKRRVTLHPYPTLPDSFEYVLINDEYFDGNDCLKRFIGFIEDEDSPVVDFDAVMSIIFDSIKDLQNGIMTVDNLIWFLSREVILTGPDFSVHTEATLCALLQAYIETLIRHLRILGVLDNDVFNYRFHSLREGNAILLQRTDSHTGSGLGR